MNRLTYRKIVNNVMLTLTGLCTLFTVSILFPDPRLPGV